MIKVIAHKVNANKTYFTIAAANIWLETMNKLIKTCPTLNNHFVVKRTATIYLSVRHYYSQVFEALATDE
jgi:hypothetical protein